MNDSIQMTHWKGCWRERRHHDCAVAKIEDLLDRLDEALVLVARAANDSIVTTSDGPGCFFCDWEEHAVGCPAAELLGLEQVKHFEKDPA